MLNSSDIQYFQSGSIPRSHDTYSTEDRAGDSRNDGIPSRYRDGRGGIDLEQVTRDQREARRQVLQAMIQRLGQVKRRR